jgi:hypothetical protein
MIKIGFVVQDIISFNLFKDLIIRLQGNEEFKPIVIFAGLAAKGLVKEVKMSNIEFINPFNIQLDELIVESKSVISADSGNCLIRRFIPKSIKLFLSQLKLVINIIPEVMKLRRKKLDAEKIVRRFNYIISSQDRPFNTALVLLSAAHNLGIKVIQVPVAMLLEEEQAAWSRKTHDTFLTSRRYNRSHTQNFFVTFINKIAAKVAPRHVINSRYGKLLPYEGFEILKLKLSGLLTDNLWFHGTKYSSYFLMADSIDASILVRGGVDKNKVLVFGSPLFDKLKISLSKKSDIKNKLYKDYKFLEDKDLVIFNIQNLSEHKLVPEKESKYFYKLILETLRDIGNNVLLTLHPSMKLESYLYLKDIYGFPIIQVPIVELLPAADIFLTGPNSSTLRFANFINIKFAQLDFFDSQNKLIKNDRNFRTCQSIADLENFMREAKPVNAKVIENKEVDLSFENRFMNLIKEDYKGEVYPRQYQ